MYAMNVERTVALANPDDLLSLTSLTGTDVRMDLRCRSEAVANDNARGPRSCNDG
jgi:hypothetical protein